MKRENAAFAGIEQQERDLQRKRRKEFSRRVARCSAEGCANDQNLSPSFDHTRQDPNMICAPCRFDSLNVPEDLPPATKQDWRIFSAGFLDEKRELPVRATQVNNRWYHAGRMTAMEILRNEEKEKADRMPFERRAKG